MKGTRREIGHIKGTWGLGHWKGTWALERHLGNQEVLKALGHSVTQAIGHLNTRGTGGTLFSRVLMSLVNL